MNITRLSCRTRICWKRGLTAWSIPVRFALLLAFPQVSTVRAADPTQKAAEHAPVAEINTPSNELLGGKGYDPVAYFVEGKPEKGSDSITTRWKGVTWKFVSEANRKTFLASPDKYAPQFGGYCAFAISTGAVVDADPRIWAIEKGRLYLNNNPLAKRLWDSDRPGRIQRGDSAWAALHKHPVK